MGRAPLHIGAGGALDQTEIVSHPTLIVVIGVFICPAACAAQSTQIVFAMEQTMTSRPSKIIVDIRSYFILNHLG